MEKEDGIVQKIIDDKATTSDAHRRTTKLDANSDLVTAERKLATDSGRHPVHELPPVTVTSNDPAFWFLMAGAICGYIAFGALLLEKLQARLLLH